MKNRCCGSEEAERPMPGRKERVNHKTLTFMLAFLYTHTHTHTHGGGLWCVVQRGCSVLCGVVQHGCRSAEQSANIHTNIILPVQAAETLCLGRFCNFV